MSDSCNFRRQFRLLPFQSVSVSVCLCVPHELWQVGWRVFLLFIAAFLAAARDISIKNDTHQSSLAPVCNVAASCSWHVACCTLQAADKQDMLAYLAIAWFAKLFCNFCSCCNKKMNKTVASLLPDFPAEAAAAVATAKGHGTPLVKAWLAASSCLWPLNAAPQLIWQLEVALSACLSLSRPLCLSLTFVGLFFWQIAAISFVALRELRPSQIYCPKGNKSLTGLDSCVLPQKPQSCLPLSPSLLQSVMALTVSLSLSHSLPVCCLLFHVWQKSLESTSSISLLHSVSILFWDSSAALTYQFQPYICDEQLIFFILKWNRNWERTLVMLSTVDNDKKKQQKAKKTKKNTRYIELDCCLMSHLNTQRSSLSPSLSVPLSLSPSFPSLFSLPQKLNQ